MKKIHSIVFTISPLIILNLPFMIKIIIKKVINGWLKSSAVVMLLLRICFLEKNSILLTHIFHYLTIYLLPIYLTFIFHIISNIISIIFSFYVLFFLFSYVNPNPLQMRWKLIIFFNELWCKQTYMTLFDINNMCNTQCDAM